MSHIEYNYELNTINRKRSARISLSYFFEIDFSGYQIAYSKYYSCGSRAEKQHLRPGQVQKSYKVYIEKPVQDIECTYNENCKKVHHCGCVKSHNKGTQRIHGGQYHTDQNAGSQIEQICAEIKLSFDKIMEQHKDYRCMAKIRYDATKRDRTCWL